MKKASLLNEYLTKYGASLKWKLCSGPLEDIQQALVIPAYAEWEMLFETLASVADNPASSLDRTLIICVINNKEDASESIRDNNSKTMRTLDTLIKQRFLDSFNSLNIDNSDDHSLRKIASSRIRLGYIDASSPGLEIPGNEGGVGMARKIGMDMALRLLRNSEDNELRLILSLDADTRVRPDYLPEIRKAFSQGKMSTGIVSYEHQMPSDVVGLYAICAYEIFLRYWVWGLNYAGSPYAFHSIGSTIATTTEAYLSVRGMNRREAGEDFYFLNKLAKIGPVRTITGTTVYPSARISKRVPFGTGAAVEKITSYRDQEYELYDPGVFVILKMWLEYMQRTSYSCNAEQILVKARSIHHGLENFLISRKFISVWPKIQSNVKNFRACERQFHNWFDGFETLKLINDLTRKFFPKIGVIPAVRRMMSLQNIEFPANLTIEHQGDVLKYLRSQSMTSRSHYQG